MILLPFRNIIMNEHTRIAKDKIHFQSESENPQACVGKILYDIWKDKDAPKPERWLAFLDGLLEADDIVCLQEFMGYCLIPSNRGQKMLLIIGKGGEGKSRVTESKKNI